MARMQRVVRAVVASAMLAVIIAGGVYSSRDRRKLTVAPAIALGATLVKSALAAAPRFLASMERRPGSSILG